jgi:uncharacterized membrane protein YdjX (TVP38/TMEM64 family)
MNGRQPRWALLAALLVTGLVLAWWRPVDAAAIAALADSLVHHPAGIAAAIAVQALLFALALPGSLMLWAVAPFHAWPAAAAILTAGSVGGALGGYGVASWLGADWRRQLQTSPAFRILARDGGFLAQCALRALPGFPHSVVNYGGGLLGLPVAPFTAAAVVGLGLKSAVFAYTVATVVAVGSLDELLRPRTVAPLAILALLFALGALLRTRWPPQG